ncbi:MAG: DinB family protein, partial [Planctomycetota bacterium]
MGVLDDLIEQYRFNTEAIASRLEGLDREQLLRRPDGTGSHAIWLLGHIASSRGIILNWLRPDEPSDLTEDEVKLFGMGSKIAEEDVYPLTERLFER